ncbi:MAG: hypothetical protein B0D91_14555 [Oceanospirillales bacterium LUC14_002_19_P2]|nr:MAG: hypothetical protein B0D91_14555 [Oceanospirillales bacterium LUC14_002_19_P2]
MTTMIESRTPAHVSYALIALNIPTAFPMLVAVIMAYVYRARTDDALLYSHYTWQIRTFWINLLLAIIGLGLTLLLIGYLVLFLNQLYLLYRLVVGWYRLSQERYPVEW